MTLAEIIAIGLFVCASIVWRMFSRNVPPFPYEEDAE